MEGSASSNEGKPAGSPHQFVVYCCGWLRCWFRLLRGNKGGAGAYFFDDSLKSTQIKIDDYKDTPRTLLLGSGAVSFVLYKLKRKLTEIEQWEAVSIQSDFES